MTTTEKVVIIGSPAAGFVAGKLVKVGTKAGVKYVVKPLFNKVEDSLSSLSRKLDGLLPAREADELIDEAIDFTSSAGRISNSTLTRKDYLRLEKWLKKRGGSTVRGQRAENFLDGFTTLGKNGRPQKKGAAFSHSKDKRQIYLRNNATYREVYHEIGHFRTLRHFEQNGLTRADYELLGMPMREHLASKFVLARVNPKAFQNQLSFKEIRKEEDNLFAGFDKELAKKSLEIRYAVESFILRRGT